jgi:hypothetical protein
MPQMQRYLQDYASLRDARWSLAEYLDFYLIRPNHPQETRRDIARPHC